MDKVFVHRWVISIDGARITANTADLNTLLEDGWEIKDVLSTSAEGAIIVLNLVKE